MSHERLLERSVPAGAYVQNRPSEAHFVFNSEQAQRNAATALHNHDGNDFSGSLELSHFNRALTSRRGMERSFSAEREKEMQDEAYILHKVEEHHTLTGIALQYRITVINVSLLLLSFVHCFYDFNSPPNTYLMLCIYCDSLHLHLRSSN